MVIELSLEQDLRETLDRVRVGDFIAEQSLTAIARYYARLRKALDDRDLELAIGCSKDLAECVARTVMATLGEEATPGTPFNSAVSAAHAALDRRPGFGRSADGLTRDLAQLARAAVFRLDVIRNTFGTGHGKDHLPEIPPDLAQITCDLAVAWCAWALRRCASRAGSDVNELISRLSSGVFSQGDLAGAISAIDIGDLYDVVQFRLGVAVARRAMRETFLVRYEGVHACTSTTDTDKWPIAYRRGLVRGMLLTPELQLEPDEWSIERIIELLELQKQAIGDEFLTSVDVGLDLGLGLGMLLAQRAVPVERELARLAPRVPSEMRTGWERILNAVVGLEH